MNDKKPLKVEITSKTIFFTIGILLTLYILYILQSLLMNLFLAFIFMSAFKPSVDFLESKKVPRILAVLLVIGSVLAVFGILLYYVLPPLVTETSDFLTFTYHRLYKIFGKNNFLPLNSLAQQISNITGSLTKIINIIFSNIIGFVSLIFFTVYFLLDITQLDKLLSRFLNEKQTSFFLEVIGNVQKKLGAWVRGELILMLIIGLMSYVGLSIIGVRYTLPLAIIAGLFEVFPVMGPILSAIPAVLIASSTSPILGLTVIVLYIIIHQSENNLVVPFVMKQSMGLSPLATLISLIIGGKLLGTAGVILSVPIVATLFIIFQNTIKFQNKN